METQNNLTNPADQEMPKFLAGMRKDIDDVSKTNQFYKGDWVEIFEDITIEETTPRVFSFTDGIDPRDIFSLGDPIRWKEDGGAYQYGYVFEISATDFTAINDNFDTSPSAEITDLARGIVRQPVGHPKRFHNQATQANGDFSVASGSVTAGKVGVDWWMDGAVINLIGTCLGGTNQSITTSSASTFNIEMLMPWLQLRNDPNVSGYVNISTPHPLVVSQGNEAHGQCNFTTFVSGDIYTLGMKFQRKTLSNWGSGTYDVDFDIRGVPYDLG